MGLHFSRLALAIALCLPLASSLHAAEQLDEFYTEIKGPDSQTSPLVVPQQKPVVESQTVQPQAPVVKRISPTRQATLQPHTPTPYVDVVAQSEPGQIYGPVKSSDTLWSIAERMRPSSKVSVHQTMLAIYRNNPAAFAGGRLNGLYSGVRLVVPSVAQIKTESDAQAQQLLKSGGMKLAAKPSAMVKTTTASSSSVAKAKVVKLSPGSAPLVDNSTTPVTKPVVKLTPENPGVSAADTPVAQTRVAVEPSPTTAAPSSSAASGEVVSSKITIPSQPADGQQVDASVRALVASEGSNLEQGVSKVTTVAPGNYQQEMAALTESNKQLQQQVKQLSTQLDEIKSLLAQQSRANGQPVPTAQPISAAAVAIAPHNKPVAEPVAVTPSAAPAPAAQSSTPHLLTPLNVGLFMGISLLALGIFWLRLRARNAQSAHHEDESVESGLLDESDSHFDHLMAADMVVLGDLPDLEQRDETLQSAPDVVLAERTEPSFSLPEQQEQIELPEPANQIGTESSWSSKPDPQLVPDEQADLGLGEEEVDLAAQEPEPAFAPRASVTLTDEELMAQFGITPEPEVPAETVTAVEEAAEPEMPQSQEANDFQPRENLNLSNDELEALFSSVEEHDATEFISPDDELDEEASVQDSAHVDAGTTLTAAEEAELALRSQLEQGDKAALADAPAADWYQEEAQAPAVGPVAGKEAAQFKGIDELLAEAEANLDKEEPYQGLSFDVGLDEFPEVMPGQQGVDVDADGGVGAKLDLARAYLEIDDKSSAVELLNEVLAQGDDTQKAEAERLIKRLS